MTNLHRLHAEQGQSPWLDNLTRDHLRSGHLQRLIERGVRGVTANPTILANAISGSTAYDEQLARLVHDGADAEEAYWALVIDDVCDALDRLGPLHEGSGGDDGFVSLEVSPALAYDAPGSTKAAAALHQRIARPNLLVKIPATAEGIIAIREATAAGHSINVTLIFSLERYAQVIEAYLSGLEILGRNRGDLRRVRSVASFFVSRVDTEVERRLNASGGPGDLKGKVAVAQARHAYSMFRDAFTGPRWNALVARGASVQRPLWASTSTKDAALRDTLYVDSLIGPDTVTTLPEPTIDAFDDHGAVTRTVDLDPDGAAAVLAEASARGVDLVDVGRKLEDQGVAAFTRSFAETLDRLRTKITVDA
jgi:transaldolase